MANVFSLFGEIGVNIKPLEDGLNKAGERLRDANGRFVKAGQSAEQFGQSTTAAGKATSGFSQIINDNASKLNAVGGALAGAGAGLTAITGTIIGATAAMFALTKETAAYGSQISDIADKTGLGAEALTALDYAASLSGSSLEEVSGAVTKFNKLIGDASAGSDEAKEKLARLGIDPKKGMTDLEGAFSDVIKKIYQMPAGAAQTKLAMDAFGRSGASLLPMIKTMGGDFESFKAKAKALGLTLTDDVAQALDGFDDKLATVDKQFAAIKRSISIAFLPVFQKMADAVSSFIANNKDTLSRLASAIAAPFEWLASVFQSLPSGVQTFIVVLAGLVGVLGPVLVAVGGLLASVTLLPALWASVVAGATAVGTALASFAAAAAPIIAIIAGIVAVGYLLYKAWDTNFLGIVDIVTSAWESIKSAFWSAVRFIDDVIATGLAIIQGWWQEHSAKVLAIIDGIKTTVSNVFNKIKATAVAIYDALVKRLNDFWAEHGEFITRQLNRIWSIVQTIFDQVKDYIGTVISVISKMLKGDWAGAWEEAKEYLARTWERVKSIVKTALEYIIDSVSTLLPKILTHIKNSAVYIWETFWKVLDKLPGLFESAIGFVGDVLKSGARYIWDAVIAIGTGILNILGGLKDKALEYGKAFISEYVRGFAQSGNIGIALASALGATASKVSKDVSNSFNGIALPAINNFTSGIKSSSNEAGFLEGIINSLSGSISGLFDSTTAQADAAKKGAKDNKDNAEALAGKGGGGGKSVAQAADEAAQAIAQTRMELLLYGKETRLAKFDTEAMAGAYSKWTDAQILFQRWQLFTLDLLDRSKKKIEENKKAMDDLIKSLTQLAQADMGPIGKDIKDILPKTPEGGGPSIGGRITRDTSPMEPPPTTQWDIFFLRITDGFNKIKMEMPSFTQVLADATVGFVNTFGDAFANAVMSWDGTLKGFLNSVASTFRNFIKQVIAEIFRLIAVQAMSDLLGGLFGSMAGGNPKGFFGRLSNSLKPGTVVAKASGGLIKGPGSGMSDSIPAMLSNGEYVIPAKAVRAFGVGFFDQIRNMQMPVGAMATPSPASVSNNSSVSTMNNNFTINVPAGNGSQKTGAMVQRDILTALRKTERRNR